MGAKMISYIKEKSAVFLTIITLIMLFAGITYAQSQTEEIHACANPAGQLRIVESTDECKQNETPLTWNVVGPQGVQGG